jgi:hypothetical protein
MVLVILNFLLSSFLEVPTAVIGLMFLGHAVLNPFLAKPPPPYDLL